MLCGFTFQVKDMGSSNLLAVTCIFPSYILSFLIVNSVALEGDGCIICRTAEAKLIELSHQLNCSLKVGI